MTRTNPARRPTTASLSLVRAADARRLLLHAHALLDDPATRPGSTPRSVARLVEALGFVQIDTISTVERAHHLILAARMHNYRFSSLSGALEGKRPALFEHWTHDASVIPLKWYPHWRFRFDRYRAGTWHRKHLGPDGDRVLDEVLKRVAQDGPLASRDFEHTGPKRPSSWWGWKPHKIALDYLWRVGVLHVASRVNFQKVYDLTERVIPNHVNLPKPAESDHVDWACRTALDRLGGLANPREIAQFFAAVTLKQVTTWLSTAQQTGEVLPVLVESADGSSPRPSFALPDLSKRIARLPDPPAGIRLLSPFDPVLRDRARAKRLFNFDFRFEGFVPAGQRKHGYYAMGILDGEDFVGRVAPKFDRREGMLRVPPVTWEAGVKPTRKRVAAFQEGAEKLAEWIGARSVKLSGNPD